MGDTLIGAEERWFLRLESDDLQGAAFSPGLSDLSDRYYLVWVQIF